MIDFQTALVAEFNAVTPESYYEINRNPTVTYPYLTFTYQTDAINRNQEGFTIEANLFSRGPDLRPILLLEEKLRAHFKGRRLMTPEVFLQFQVLGTNVVPTSEENLRRRDVRIYCKTDWRKQ